MPKNNPESFISQILESNIVPLIPIPITWWSGEKILNNYYSLSVHIVYFLSILLLFSLTIAVILLKSQRSGTRIKAAIILVVAFFVAASFTILFAASEDAKGFISIEVDKRSSKRPEKIILIRNMPPFLNFLNKPITLEFDEARDQFFIPHPIRFGKWRTKLYPLHEFRDCEKVLSVTKANPYTKTKELFHKALCKVFFSAYTLNENNSKKVLLDVKIRLHGPIPFGFDLTKKAPCFMEIELSTIHISMACPGYKDSKIETYNVFPGEEIKIDIKLEKEEIAILTGDSNSLKLNFPPIKEKEDHREEDSGWMDSNEVLIPDVEALNILNQSIYFLRRGQYRRARLLLTVLSAWFPGQLDEFIYDYLDGQKIEEE